METIRSAFTVISLLTFFGVVFWAFSQQGRRSAASANAALLGDDDRTHLNSPTPNP
jgi:cbb3-type cytochrome oxidase subunit 3